MGSSLFFYRFWVLGVYVTIPRLPFSFDRALSAHLDATLYGVFHLLREDAESRLDATEDLVILSVARRMEQHVRLYGTSMPMPTELRGVLPREADIHSARAWSQWGELDEGSERRLSLYRRAHFLDFLSRDYPLLAGAIGHAFTSWQLRAHILNILEGLLVEDVAQPNQRTPVKKGSLPWMYAGARQRERLAQISYDLTPPWKELVCAASPEWAVEWDRVAGASSVVTLGRIADAYHRCVCANQPWSDLLVRWVYVQDPEFQGPAAKI